MRNAVATLSVHNGAPEAAASDAWNERDGTNRESGRLSSPQTLSSDNGAENIVVPAFTHILGQRDCWWSVDGEAMC
jgi:hypothetical protein